MSWMRRRPAGRRTAAATTAALAAAVALTAAACGPGGEETDSQGKPAIELPDGIGQEQLDDLLGLLPEDIDIDEWKNGEWRNWDRGTWLREAGQYISVIIEDFWDAERMRDARDQEKEVDESEIDEAGGGDGTGDPADDRGVTDPAPALVEAIEADRPYSASRPAVGKIFMETPEGSMVCSGAVVQDPGRPGASNLVATAGHCVHAGAEGGWFRNIAFVPAFHNDDDIPWEDMTPQDFAPYGIFWADNVSTTQYWVDHGSAVGGDGAHQDFAVMSVVPEDGGGASLEETVGTAYEIAFDAPAVSGVDTVQAVGYPAAEPYDGQRMYGCADAPARLSLDDSQPGMYRIGCSMTGGSSGGPWLSPGAGGSPRLASVTSIGPADNSWLAGPRLEQEARRVFDEVRAS